MVRWNIDPKEIYNLYMSGMSLGQISKKFDKHVQTVYGKLRRTYKILSDELVDSGKYDESLSTKLIKFECRCGCGEYIEKLGTPYNLVKSHCIKDHQGHLSKGITCSESSKEKMRKPKSEAHRENISKGRKGYVPKKESIEKWKRSMGKKGYTHLRTPEYRHKMSEIMTGKKKSKGHREKMSNYMKGRPYNNYKRGFYRSSKAGEIFYRSSLELMAYILLDNDKYVRNYSTEPFLIPYSFKEEKLYYRPDLQIYWTDNTRTIAEVKPEHDLKLELNKEKFRGARDFCMERNMLFDIMTDTYLNKAIAKQGELLEHLNSYFEKDNQQPSSLNESTEKVNEKVQRLFGEDDSTNNPNTSALDS